MRCPCTLIFAFPDKISLRLRYWHVRTVQVYHVQLKDLVSYKMMEFGYLVRELRLFGEMEARRCPCRGSRALAWQSQGFLDRKLGFQLEIGVSVAWGRLSVVQVGDSH
mgnify:CR=1 FL=1